MPRARIVRQPSAQPSSDTIGTADSGDQDLDGSAGLDDNVHLTVSPRLPDSPLPAHDLSGSDYGVSDGSSESNRASPGLSEEDDGFASVYSASSDPLPDPDDGYDFEWLSRIPSVRTAQLFVYMLREASLNDGQLNAEQLQRLLNPIEEAIDLQDGPDGRDRDLLLSMRLFLAHTTSSQENYQDSIDAVRTAFPQCKPLRYETVKKRLEEITGVVTVYDDLCIDSCVAYTGPYASLEECPVCGQARFHEGSQTPRNRMSTVLLGPQLQALHRHERTGEMLDYWAEQTQLLLQQLELGQTVEEFSDMFCGSDVIELLDDKKLLPDDSVIMLSLDGAQLFRNKKSTFWISIYVILNFSPEEGRYKVKYVLPGSMIPGPNKPIVMESVLYTMLHHISAVNRRGGLPVWDAYRATERYIAKCREQGRPSGLARYDSGLFTILFTADAEAMPILNSLVGPTGKCGCRVRCPMPSRRIPGLRGGHYYPMMAKPENYAVAGCDHDSIDYDHPYDPIGQDEYLQLVDQICDPNLTLAQYKVLRRETGVSKPSILIGLWLSHERPMILGLPRMCPGDAMHEIMNISTIMLSLWRGTIDCLATDSRNSWDWMVLTGETWLQHGRDIAACRPFVPSLFERWPRNPAEKISSGFKAVEYSNYIFVAGPAHLHRVLPLKYWVNYCKLVGGMQQTYQKSVQRDRIEPSRQLLCDFLRGFEALYIQGRQDRMH
ncbi:hypothetical protein EXIGLDRAFT_763628 [Exidia glandulosa HHB12029]|uniref:Transposase domain-containing protein n=1 Tax=Exidia glandulosa HHB12029 TaxID=1314781 RepID=A0A165LU17_EXIGL|nr:hypothetical protein EXIGLDRAFT_763628 [Exidia glandulosa HHB12029]